MKRLNYILVLFLCTQFLLSAQELVHVNNNGVLLSTIDDKEVSYFGANYCLPSACDYRMAGLVGGDRKKMIDQDLVHFKRMGFDAIRLSFWGDWENSDTKGNLLNNEHLDLLDYLIAVASKHGMNMLFSPIITYSANWPDKYQVKDMPGFSAHNEKWQLIVDSSVIAAEQNYMTQILNHVNKYTGVALKNEPNIIAVEIVNEPTQLIDKIPETTEFIRKMYATIRSTGCKKHVCYNISQDFRIAPAILDSPVEGASYAWYPTQLNNGFTLKGNILPFVSEYAPMNTVSVGNRTKWVYEFDVPDVSSSCMYPAMVRSFRQGGAQFAAMFSYDMLQTARFNLGWQSHNLNMVYTPQKAVSAIIAAKAMKIIPRGASYGSFPQNNTFGPFRVDFEANVSLYADQKHLYHSNTIDESDFKHPTQLEQIVGYGSSPFVKTDGKGIYFLDKLDEGHWRLELYPDAVEVSDPFLMPNINKVSHELVSRPVLLSLNLPGLVDSAFVYDLNQQKVCGRLRNGSTTLLPGLYMLTVDKAVDLKSYPQNIHGIGLTEMVLPDVSSTQSHFIHHSQEECLLNKGLRIDCKVVGQVDTADVCLFYKVDGGYFKKASMHQTDWYDYSTTLSLQDLGANLPTGETRGAMTVEYVIAVKQGSISRMYPSGVAGTPWDWDYNQFNATYRTKMVAPNGRVNILNVERDKDRIRKTRVFWSLPYDNRCLTDSLSNDMAYQVWCANMDSTVNYLYPLDVSFNHYIRDRLKARVLSGLKPTWMELKVRNCTPTTNQILIGFNQSNGVCWGAKVKLTPNWETVRIPVSNLTSTLVPMLPQDWPGIDPYYYPKVPDAKEPDWSLMEHVSVSMRASLYPKETGTPKGFQIQSIELVF